MTFRKLTIMTAVVVTTLCAASAGRAQTHDDTNRLYHYPYYYFPHNYAPRYERWPDPKKPYQQPPRWMAYPPHHDPNFRYELWRPHRFHKGFHFWLDQF